MSPLGFSLLGLESSADGDWHNDRAASTSASSVSPRPTPSQPLPGGSGSSGTAGSAGGAGFSIFLLLFGLLSIGGLAAMRLLRLASEPWHVAPFVLIPERPG
jgi:hypothetical protein